MPKTRKVGSITLYFKEESVIMMYNNQCVCFHSWNVRNKSLLQSFSSSLMRSRKIDLDLIYKRAREFDIPSFGISGDSVAVINKQIREIRHG